MTDDPVRASYDAVAQQYEVQVQDELSHKPLDRAMLQSVVELAGLGTIADIGCGPGHVTRFLAALHDDVLGLDLSAAMVALAGERAPRIPFRQASMLALPVPDASWAGLVAFYSIIHLDAGQRATAFAEFRRVLRPGGYALLAFHISSAEYAAGEVGHLSTWFGHDVELSAYYLPTRLVTDELTQAGLAVTATLERDFVPDEEFPSRRGYLIARRPLR